MTEVTMPQLGESVIEGTVGKWLKKVGDQVKKYEPLLEVITDKVDVEIPSPAEGVLSRILVREGETVQVGTVLALLEKEVPKAEAPVEVAPPPEAEWVSPAVAKLAAEHGVDLRQVKGTGTGGRITKQDILRFVEERYLPSPLPPSRGRVGEGVLTADSSFL